MRTLGLLLCLALAACGDDDAASADAAPVADGPIDNQPDADTADAGAADGQTGVSCGPDFCEPGTEKCCVMAQGGGATTETCVPKNDNCSGADVSCDGPEDCTAPEVCCGTLMGGGSSSCSAVGDCGGASLIVCQTGTDCPQDKPNCCQNAVLGASTCSMTTCPP